MNIDWQTYRTRVRSAGSTTWPRGETTNLPWVRYTSDNDLWLITGGDGWIETSTGRARLRSGVCLWLRPGVNYGARQHAARPISLRYVHFDLVSIDGALRPGDHPLPPEVLEVPDPVLVKALFERITGLLPVTDRPTLPPSRQAQVDALLTCLAMELDIANSGRATPVVFGGQLHRRDTLNELAKRIDAAPGVVPSVPELASQSGYSTPHFTRAFKTQFGMSPVRFIIRARMNMAMQLLTSSSLRVREVATRVGYKDQFLFHRQFKRYAGQTPAQYRRSVARQVNRSLLR